MTCLSEDRPLRFHTVMLFAVVVIVSSLETNAQIFPVQVNPQLTPPYTPYLSDYTTPGSQRLTVRLRINDPTLAEYRCKLRVTIEGVGITLRTKQHFIPQPLVLPGGGVPQIFYGDDLAEYLNPSNLDFSGLSISEFNKTGKLPEGVYRFSFEVLDYNRNTVVSNKGMAMAWIILNDPPILNLPKNETKINLIDPTNIVFTWTPRHKGSPNAALTTEYSFRLVEVWPLNKNPYDAFLTQPPLYEVTTVQQEILYGPAEPALIPGRKYAWQVQAVDLDKRDLFKNQGRSEVFVFQYGDALNAPENLRLQSANPSNLTVRWDQTTGGSLATNYRIQYREHKGRSSQTWYENQTSDQWKAIPMLKPDTEYEVQVRSEQQFQQSDYTSTKIFKTLPVGENEFVCRDDAPPPPMPASTGPLFDLSINDVITVGGYEVVIRQVKGGTGQYTGEGMAIVPYLNGAKVRVVFENIRVNEQNMVTSGTVKSYWNPDSKFLLEKKEETLPSQTPTTGEIPVTIATTETLIEITGAAIATITTDEDGDIIVHTTDGEERELKKGESYSVVDEVGNGYIIDNDGNIAKTTDEEAKAAHERSKRKYSLALKFDKGDGTFGFDDLIIKNAANYSALAQHYQQVGDGKFIAWKAVTSSRTDAVFVIPDDASIDLSTVRFEVNAAPLQPQQSVGGIKLQLQGKGGGMVEELIATSGDGEDEQILGKLNLVSYDQLDKNVVIVPVNNAALPSSLTAQAITIQLTEIFSQAVTSVRASVSEKLTVSLDDSFDDGETGMFSNYTGDMKKVINAYGRLQDNTYYLFLVNKPRSGTSTLGFMPRSKQAGFIFADNHRGDPTRLIRTMAHELAHGMFNLKHTFSDYPGLGEGNTQNLMDYSQGSELLKYQWDHVHDPQSVIPLFEGDEEGESSWTLVDKKHTVLFNHIYDNHHLGNMVYLDKLNEAITAGSKDDLGLDYKDNQENEWVNSWKIRLKTLEETFNDELAMIQTTKKGEKIPAVYLRPKNIYIGKYEYEGEEYPVAIYGNGAKTELLNVFTKVQVSDLDELQKPEIRKNIYVEETYTKYFIIAFYEEGKGNDPSMIMQVEKFVFNNSLEKWLKYLNILVEDPVKKEEDKKEEHNPFTEAIKIAGINRVALAAQINESDTRLYRQVIEANGRLTDDYVDCAEFVYDILGGEDIISPSGDCVIQFDWYKNQKYYWGTGVKDIKKGDILLWDDPDDAANKTLNHTGFAAEDYNNSTIPIIHSGLNGCYCGSYTYPVFQKDEEGNILLDESDDKVILYETVADCDQQCISESRFSITKLNTYIKSNGNTESGDLKFKYWVRPKK